MSLPAPKDFRSSRSLMQAQSGEDETMPPHFSRPNLTYPIRRALLVGAMVALSVDLLIIASPDYAQNTTAPPTTSLAGEDRSIRPFTIHVPQTALDDLRQRINATRWPDRETVTDRSQGVQLEQLQALMRYWGTDYDWRKLEKKLNDLPQFVTTIDGVDIHFIHVRSRHPKA